MARKALIQFRRDTAANWASVNPVLADAEVGVETDTGKFKIGNGISSWTALSYPPVSGVVSQTNGTVTTASTSSGVVRNIYTSTSNPTGGIDGDIWMVYT